MKDLKPAIEISNMSKHVYIAKDRNRNIIEKVKEIFVHNMGERFYILKDINIVVPKLSTIGIIGKNGSGKSSLLKLIANINSPSAGYIKTNGRIAAILDIGSGFHPELTGKENILFYGKIIGMTEKEIERKNQSIIDFSELGEFIERPVKHYSNGMYLRLAFSIAVHSDADIILFDEVLTVGDVAFNLKCFQKINEIKKDTTVVLVSHNMEDITRVCNLCVWLDQGEVKAFGNTNEVVSDYILSTLQKNKYLEEYFNSSDFYTNNTPNKLGIILNSFSISNIKGYQVKVLDYSESFKFVLHLTLTQEIENILMPTIQIIDKSNNTLLFSSTVFQGKPFITLNKKGEYHLSCSFPKKVLNRGIYRVNFFLFDDEQKICLEQQDVCLFKIEINDSDLDYYIKRTSISISPALNWQMEN